MLADLREAGSTFDREPPGAINMRRLVLMPIPFADAVFIDRACGWGRKSVEAAIPVTSALLQPTWWEGDNSPVAEPKTRAKSVASPMSAVMAAIHLPTSRFARWRNRRLT